MSDVTDSSGGAERSEARFTVAKRHLKVFRRQAAFLREAEGRLLALLAFASSGLAAPRSGERPGRAQRGLFGEADVFWRSAQPTLQRRRRSARAKRVGPSRRRGKNIFTKECNFLRWRLPNKGRSNKAAAL